MPKTATKRPLSDAEKAKKRKEALAILDYPSRALAQGKALYGAGKGIINDGLASLIAGAGAMNRMVSRPEFKGEVDPNKTHILVDDVITLGGTMGEASDYIQRLGGDIGGIVGLINKSRGDKINAPQSLIDLIRQRYGNVSEEEFGIIPEALTRPEAEYLAQFGNADRIRSAAARARAKK